MARNKRAAAERKTCNLFLQSDPELWNQAKQDFPAVSLSHHASSNNLKDAL